MNGTVVVGWDVGGWLGRKQAVAAALVDPDGAWAWRGAARTFNVSAISDGRVDSLVRIAWPDAPDLSSSSVVIAIDAPLSFPRAFARLVSGEPPLTMGWSREIDNPLAYRDCDRFVAATYGKKPLSASFDKLGNNTTVAMTLIHRWRSQGFQVLPFDPADEGRVVIEAYPALYKRSGIVVERARALLPGGLVDGSDEKDATLCALTGLAFAGARDERLPKLLPVRNELATDGWIFGPEPGWVNGSEA